MKSLKKIIAIILMLSLVAGLCACANKNTRPVEEPQRVPVQDNNTTNMENTESSAKEDKFPEISEKYTEAYIQETVETIGMPKGLFYTKKTEAYCVENSDGTYTLHHQQADPYTFSVDNLIACFAIQSSDDAIIIYKKDGAVKADLLNWVAENSKWGNFLTPPCADFGILTGTTELYYRDTVGDLDVKEYNDIQDVYISENYIHVVADGRIFKMGKSSLGITVKPGESKFYLSCDTEDAIEGTAILGYESDTFYENNDKQTLCVERGSTPWTIAMPEGTTTDDIKDITYNHTTDTGHMLLKNGYVYVVFGLKETDNPKWVLDTEVTTFSLENDLSDIKVTQWKMEGVTNKTFDLYLRTAEGLEYYVQYPQQ